MKEKFNCRHIICGAVTVGIICLTFAFPCAFGRFFEGARDLGVSFAYYFLNIFDIPNDIVPTVTELSRYKATVFLPVKWEVFIAKFGEFTKLLADKDNLSDFVTETVNSLSAFARFFIVAVVPLILTGIIVFRVYISRQNNDYDEDSRPLKVFKKITAKFFIPIKTRAVELFAFAREKKYFVVWACICLFYFNVFTIALEFLAYYLYFSVSFDFVKIYLQVYKLAVDLAAPVTFIPVWAWAIAAYLIVCRVRKDIAVKRLYRFERRNRGFINERPIVYMVCGTMGKKKTTAVTDMALSQEMIFRNVAFEKLLENDLKFPFFPWINIENEIKRAMEYHEIYTLATCRNFVAKKKARWQKAGGCQRIFGYDYLRYGTVCDDKLKLTDVWEVVENYAQLYFIYVLQSSLILSNYSVRTDCTLSGVGNFPLWDDDFISRDNRLIRALSRHSHILDMDSLRLGRKVVEGNALSDSFEFGVVLMTEIGKERGNNLELIEKKKKDDATNQKNDLFNYWLKMVRHSATVDNYPFVKVITDEQRPASWGADARELCDIVTIVDSGDKKLAMPMFVVTEMLYEFFAGRFENLYQRYRFNRGDNTLTMYVIKKLFSLLHNYYTNKYNLYGYSVLKLKVEAGTQDGKKATRRYYLANKKIYGKRFSTDCFSDFFMKKSIRSKYGIADIPEYATEKATFEELFAQNSYFIRDLYYGLFGKSDE